MSEWTRERIKEAVKGYIKETLLNDEKCRALLPGPGGKSQTLPGMTFLESSDMKADEARSMLSIVELWIQNQDYRIMRPVVKRLDKELPEESAAHNDLSRELLLAFKSVLSVRIKRSAGDYSQANEELIPMLKEAPSPDPEHAVAVSKASPAVQEPLSFTALQTQFVKEIEKEKSWTEKTSKENLAVFALFAEVNGDLSVQAITPQLMADYKSTLMKLPPNMRRKKEYKGKTLQEILAMGELPQTLAASTVNKHISRLAGLFNWAVQHGYLPDNPSANI